MARGTVTLIANHDFDYRGTSYRAGQSFDVSPLHGAILIRSGKPTPHARLSPKQSPPPGPFFRPNPIVVPAGTVISADAPQLDVEYIGDDKPARGRHKRRDLRAED